MSLDHAHILICRTDNIGDVVLTLPMASYLKQLFPSAKIGFLCRSYAAPLVRLCGAIDEVVELESMGDPAVYFAQSGINTIIFAKPDRRLAAAAKKAQIPRRVGTSHRLFHWWYCNELAHFSRVKSSLHEAQLNFKLLRPLGIVFNPTLDDIPALYQLHPPALGGQINLPANVFHVLIHPKSNGNGREWPIAHFNKLAQLLQSHHDIQLWVTGSAKEQTWLEQHASDLLRQPRVTSVCGRLTLDELAGLISAADGMVASGTGPLHMSAALGISTLGLFPPVQPIHPGRWAPLGVRAQYLCQESTCGGCNDAVRCQCMERITPEQVAERVLSWYGDWIGH